jgi:hypothetical protein
VRHTLKTTQLQPVGQKRTKLKGNCKLPQQRLPNRSMAADAHKSKAGVTWLNAWLDPVANLPITSARMCLADVTGAGEVDLLAVDNANRIRVYRGTNLVSETLLLGAPSAIAPVYLDERHPIIPCVAVAVGPTLYIYKKLRPFRKYVQRLKASRCIDKL